MLKYPGARDKGTESPTLASPVNQETNFRYGHSNYKEKRMYSNWREPVGRLANFGAAPIIPYPRAELEIVRFTTYLRRWSSQARKHTNQINQDNQTQADSTCMSILLTPLAPHSQLHGLSIVFFFFSNERKKEKRKKKKKTLIHINPRPIRKVDDRRMHGLHDSRLVVQIYLVGAGLFSAYFRFTFIPHSKSFRAPSADSIPTGLLDFKSEYE